MTITTPDLGLGIIEALDFEYTPPCESEFHESSLQGHSGPAYALTWLKMSCCGAVYGGYRCKPIVEWALSGGAFWCPDCQANSVPEFRVHGYVGDSR